MVEAGAGLDPLREVVLAVEEAEEVLREVDVLGELPDPVAARVGGEEAAGRAPRRGVVVEVVGDRELAGHRHRIGADRVVDPGAVPGVDAAVVAGVVPGEHVRLHGGGVELLVVLDHLRHLRRADRDRLAVGFRDLGPVRPADRPEGGAGVEAVADLDAHGTPDLLELLAGPQEVGPGVGRPLAHLAEFRLEVVARHRRPGRLEDLPVPVHEEGVLAEGVDVTPVLLGELAHHVVEVDEAVAMAPPLLVVEHHEVVARVGLDLGGLLGGELDVRHVIGARGDARLLGELVHELLELLVGLRHEVTPAEHRHLALLTEGGRGAGQEDAGQPGCPCRRVVDELPARDWIHPALLPADARGGAVERRLRVGEPDRATNVARCARGCAEKGARSRGRRVTS